MQPAGYLLRRLANALDDLRYERLNPEEWAAVGKTIAEVRTVVVRQPGDAAALATLTEQIEAYVESARVERVPPKDGNTPPPRPVPASETLLGRVNTLIDEISPKDRNGQ